MSRWDGPEKVAVTLKCRSWNCPDCSERRKAGLIAQAIGGRPTKFITLTIRRTDQRTPESAARELSRAWRLLRLRILRHRKWKHLPFIAVFEPHASGWPHVHILARCAFIDHKWLRDQWHDITKDSFKLDIRTADNPGRSAFYCAKYCGKGTAKFGTAKRYWQSQDYDLREKPEKVKYKPGEGWDREGITLERWVQQWKDVDWIVVRVSAREVRVRPPP